MVSSEVIIEGLITLIEYLMYVLLTKVAEYRRSTKYLNNPAGFDKYIEDFSLGLDDQLALTSVVGTETDDTK